MDDPSMCIGRIHLQGRGSGQGGDNSVSIMGSIIEIIFIANASFKAPKQLCFEM